MVLLLLPLHLTILKICDTVLSGGVTPDLWYPKDLCTVAEKVADCSMVPDQQPDCFAKGTTLYCKAKFSGLGEETPEISFSHFSKLPTVMLHKKKPNKKNLLMTEKSQKLL